MVEKLDKYVLKVRWVQLLSLQEMKSVTQIQILDKAVSRILVLK